MMPYVAFVIPFWAVYNQMNTNFPIQGCQMYEEVFGMTIVAAQMSTWNTIGVLVGVPVADRIIYPLMSKYGCHFVAGVGALRPLPRFGLPFRCFFPAFWLELSALCPVLACHRAVSFPLLVGENRAEVARFAQAGRSGDLRS